MRMGSWPAYPVLAGRAAAGNGACSFCFLLFLAPFGVWVLIPLLGLGEGSRNRKTAALAFLLVASGVSWFTV